MAVLSVPFIAVLFLSITLISGAPNPNPVAEDRLHKKFEPQVATKCGYLNMYMLENGHWAVNKDGDGTCLTRKEEILSICRKAYPDLQISNIVESSQNVFIGNWCQDGSEQCSVGMWSKPYRCIAGPFQSDALLVPQGCNFSHTYDKRECKDYQFWNRTAQEACALKGEVARSFGMLVPCGIDLFSGVEYVCCPLDISSTSTEDIPIEAERSRIRSQPEKSGKTASLDEEDGDNWQADYLKDDEEFSEHEKYQTAMRKLEKHHQERLNKMMKEWTDVSAKNKELKKSDPAGAKKLKKDLMERFRKTYVALQEEFEDEKRQLNDLHQQRIAVQLNNKKREAMDGYLDEIQERHPKVNKLLKHLEKYIRAEEKDRQHTINRYRHLLNSDEADDGENSTLAQLKDLEQRINESMKMLKRVPENIAKEVEEKARAFWEQYRVELFGSNVDSDHLLGKYKQEATAQRTRSDIERQRDMESKYDQVESAGGEDEAAAAEDDEDDDDDTDDDDQLQQEPESSKAVTTPRPSTTTEREVMDKDGLSYLPPSEKFPIKDAQLLVTATTPKPEDEEDDDDTDDLTTDQPDEADLTDDDNEDSETEREAERASNKFQDIKSVGKLRKDEQPQYLAISQLINEADSTNKILYVAFGMAGVGLLAAMLLGIVLLRRRNPTKAGFAPVDTFASPEERHVATMQSHGYTNPFFNHAHQYSKA